MRGLRTRGSLLWTFAGAFLAVLVGGIVLQAVLFAAILRPAMQRWRSATREAIAQTAAVAVAGAVEDGQGDLSAVLRSVAKDPSLVLVYRDEEGRLLSSHGPDPLPRWLRGGPRGQERPRGRGLAAVAPVLVDGQRRGEVILLPRRPDRPLRIEGAPSAWILFLPLAAILAGVAGLILFRSLAGRLALLEDRFRRLEGGDLSARVDDPGTDEIGRLGSAFNSMASQLRRSREELLEADRQRRRFLADVTHDLATPLTTIRGYAETLLDSSVPKSGEEIERYLRFIQEEAIRVDALVDDLLDLARIEAGAAPLDLERSDLIELARGEVDRMRPALAAAGLALEGPTASTQRLEARVDRRRIEQLLSNLLRNAMQHVPGGGRVDVRLESRGETAIRLIVEDNGPGFRAEDLPQVFERFYRGSRARPSGGTGLGLAIVRGIARAHGGEARAENGPEGGARVIVELPRDGPALGGSVKEQRHERSGGASRE